MAYFRVTGHFKKSNAFQPGAIKHLYYSSLKTNRKQTYNYEN